MTKILLIEDNATFRFELRDYLKSSSSYEVDDCANGVEALEKIKKNKYDLVISDNQMPGILGINLIPIIRGSNAKIIFMSGSFVADTVLQAKKMGVDKFLVKPFNILDLDTSITNLLYEKMMEEEALEKNSLILI